MTLVLFTIAAYSTRQFGIPLLRRGSIKSRKRRNSNIAATWLTNGLKIDAGRITRGSCTGNVNVRNMLVSMSDGSEKREYDRTNGKRFMSSSTSATETDDILFVSALLGCLVRTREMKSPVLRGGARNTRILTLGSFESVSLLPPPRRRHHSLYRPALWTLHDT